MIVQALSHHGVYTLSQDTIENSKTPTWSKFIDECSYLWNKVLIYDAVSTTD